MAENKNFFKVDGVVYAKPVQSGVSKKTGKDYSIPSLILEIKSNYQGKTFSELPEFNLSKGVNIDAYNVGDLVTVSFSLTGKKFGDWHKTMPKAIFVKHADLDANRDNNMGKVTTQPETEKVFTGANPEDDFDGDELPF